MRISDCSSDVCSSDLALAARMTRGSMLEVLRADYMRTAKAKGLNERKVIIRHGLRHATIPVVTLIGIDLGTVIGAAVLTETVFSWPRSEERRGGKAGVSQCRARGSPVP